MNQKITFPELVELVAHRQGCSKREADAFLREFTALMSEVISSGESLRIAGLGLFKPVWVEDRASVNVQTGEPYVIPGHYKLVFTPVKSVRDAVNEPFSCFCVEVLPDDAELDDPVSGNMPMSDAGFSGDSFESEEKKEKSATFDEAAVVSNDRQEEEEDIPEKKEEVNEADIESGVLDKEQPESDNGQFEVECEGPEESRLATDKEKQEEKSEMRISDGTDYPHTIRKREWRSGFLTGFFVSATIIGFVLFCIYMFAMERQDVGYRQSAVPTDSVSSLPVDEAKVGDMMPVDAIEEAVPLEIVTDTVRRGVFLTSLSLKHYGHKAFWVYIYQENRDKIKNPDNVPAGTVVTIPSAEKYGIDAADSTAVNKALAIAAAREWE